MHNIKKQRAALKIVSIILLLAMMMTGLISCRSDTGDGGTDTTAADTSGLPGGNDEIDYLRNVPADVKYDGYTFNILTYQNATWPVYLDITDWIGEVLNDAAYLRNLEVSELFGISIATTKVTVGSIPDEVTKSNLTGASPYDLVVFWAPNNVSPLITQNQVYDWNMIPHVNLEEPWYNQSANEVFTVAGKQYFAVSDLTYPVQQHFRYLFNKDMMVNLGLETPYKLVYEGKWTHDALMTYIAGVYSDLNGNNTPDNEDRYGLAAGTTTVARSIQNWGEFPVGIGSDGFTLNIFSDRINSMFVAINDMFKSPDTLSAGNNDSRYANFNNGNSMFLLYSSDPELLRAYEVNYGYLPYPKYDELQENYITLQTGGNMAVPITKTYDELDRIGAIVEALSALSAKHVADAFVQSYFEGKILREEDDVNMYRLMRETATYDHSRFYDTTGFLGESMSYYGDALGAESPNLASRYASIGSLVEKALKTMYESILKNQ